MCGIYNGTFTVVAAALFPVTDMEKSFGNYRLVDSPGSTVVRIQLRITLPGRGEARGGLELNGREGNLSSLAMLSVRRCATRYNRAPERSRAQASDYKLLDNRNSL